MASIQVIQGPEKGRTFELTPGENIIGRGSESVPLSDGTMSRRHARLLLENGQWMLDDCGSANGTYLNGQRVGEPSPVHGGDQIRCGSSLFVFGVDGGTNPTVDIDEEGRLVDASIVAELPSNEDSIIIPTPEAGAEAIDTLRILYNLIGELSSTFDVDLLLQRTLERIFAFVKADRGYILLVGDDGKLVRKAARHGTNVGDSKIPISRTIINQVITKQVGLLSSNAMSDERFTSGKSVHNFGIRSAICVPIKGRERVLGVIHVDCSVSDHTYSTEQLRLLTAVGFQTGLAIENVRLYEEAVKKERLAAVGEAAAILSHHIKNILQALGGGIDMVDLALSKDNLDKSKEAWPIVQRNIERINGLILNMLALSKQRQPLLENVNVNHILGECIELEHANADGRGVALMTDLDDIPPIPADTAGLRHAFMNLLANAMDTVTDHTGVITISSRYDTANRSVLVSVSDNGEGIPREQLKEIFTPFFSSKGHEGTGLGLAVTRKVVEEHHGRIRLASRVGEGSTFTISLPDVRHADSADPTGGIEA